MFIAVFLMKFRGPDIRLNFSGSKKFNLIFF